MHPTGTFGSTYPAMATKRKLTIETLTKLGARKLAELLIAEAAGNRQLKQTLNLATSTQDGPAALGAIVRRPTTPSPCATAPPPPPSNT
jgi:hypothetical protein